jgi:hypothetical protein
MALYFNPSNTQNDHQVLQNQKKYITMPTEEEARAQQRAVEPLMSE